MFTIRVMAHPVLGSSTPRSATPPVNRSCGSAKRNVVPFRRAERRSESEEAATSFDSVRSEPVPIQRPARISSSRDSFGDSVASLSGSGRLRRPARPCSESFTPGVRKTGFPANGDLVLEPRAVPLPPATSQGLLSRQFSSESLPVGDALNSVLKVRALHSNALASSSL